MFHGLSRFTKAASLWDMHQFWRRGGFSYRKRADATTSPRGLSKNQPHLFPVEDIHLKTIMEGKPFSKSQRTSPKDKSTGTALQEVSGTVERKVQYTLTAFLDTEGAFNNVISNDIRIIRMRLSPQERTCPIKATKHMSKNMCLVLKNAYF